MIEIVPHCHEWSLRFTKIASSLKSILGNYITDIHHIGSTSVKNMAAKDIIDIQISVQDFAPEIVNALLTQGFSQLHYSDHLPAGIKLEQAELEKWFFMSSDPAVNLHVRKVGRFNHRYALLCRDFLRSNAAAANAYQEVKLQLAKRFADDVQGYYDIKDPVFDVLMAGAEIWANENSWSLPESDV